MAVVDGPCLLAAELAAAWISAASAASLPSEKAGRSQKPINCMPCLMMYIGMSDSGELCKGLTDDIEALTLSESHRQLLPNGVFAGPFELQHFVERKVFLDMAVFGDTNLELPSALSNRSAVEIHFDLRPSTYQTLTL
ncbi:unnamed protein product [Urochloa humidicola]